MVLDSILTVLSVSVTMKKFRKHSFVVMCARCQQLYCKLPVRLYRHFNQSVIAQLYL